MNAAFNIVMVALEWLASLTGFTYVEINIIAYLMILPFLYAAMIDGILRRHWLKIAVVVGWALALMAIPDFGAFSNRVFDVCVVFLNGFSVLGLDYVAASVVVCVILPGLAFAGLAVWWIIAAKTGAPEMSSAEGAA